MQEIILIMGKKYKKLDDINSSLNYLNLLSKNNIKQAEVDSEILRLTQEKENVEKEIEDSINALKGQ